MVLKNHAMSDFETHSRATLDASIARLDGRVRSRLTQARHAALDELAQRRSSVALRWQQWLRPRVLGPAGAVAAVAIVAVVLWTGRATIDAGTVLDSTASFDDVELLADKDALAVSTDGDYDFYEWAAAQDDAGAAAQRGG